MKRAELLDLETILTQFFHDLLMATVTIATSQVFITFAGRIKR